MHVHAALPLALLPLVAIPSHTEPALHDLSDAEHARVERQATAFLASYIDVIEGDDTEAVARLYVDDERFAWFSDGVKQYTSGEDVVASLASMKGMEFSTEVTETEVLPLTPDLAHARTSFQTEILQGDTVVYEFGGVITWLLEEVESGEWRVLRGHTSTPKER